MMQSLGNLLALPEKLRTQLEQDQRLLARVREQLPLPLSDHCLYVHQVGEMLMVLVDAPVWGTQLRFLLPKVSPEGIRSCRIRVYPETQIRLNEAQQAVARPRFSQQTAALLLETAQAMEKQHPQLAESLRRLAAAGVEAAAD